MGVFEGCVNWYNETGSSLVLLCLVLAFRIGVPLHFSKKAEKKGYSFYLIYLLGLFISVILCIIVACALPDRRSKMRASAGQGDEQDDAEA